MDHAPLPAGMTPVTPPEYVPVAVNGCGGPPGTSMALDGATVNDVSARKVAVTDELPLIVKVQVAAAPQTDASPVPDEYPVNRADAPPSASSRTDDPCRYVLVQAPAVQRAPS